MRKPAAPDAFTFIAGGPGGVATELTQFVRDRFWRIRETKDIVLVDQRGVGGSNPLECPEPGKDVKTPADARDFVQRCLRSLPGDAMQYGTRAAADDLEAVRRALGYRKLDVYGASYGATAAQVYLKRHPGSVRTLTLDSGTALDVPFYGRFAANAQHALADVAARCAADRVLRERRSRPGAPRSPGSSGRGRRHRFAPVRASKTTGVGLAGIVQSMLITPDSGRLDPARGHAGRGTELRAAEPLRPGARPPAGHVLVDLLQRAVGRARGEGAVAHRFRRLRHSRRQAGADDVQLPPEARRAGVGLDAGALEGAAALPDRRGRPAGSDRELPAPAGALPQRPGDRRPALRPYGRAVRLPR